MVTIALYLHYIAGCAGGFLRCRNYPGSAGRDRLQFFFDIPNVARLDESEVNRASDLLLKFFVVGRRVCH